jgi:hypothetical protein
MYDQVFHTAIKLSRSYMIRTLPFIDLHKRAGYGVFSRQRSGAEVTGLFESEKQQTSSIPEGCRAERPFFRF